MKRNIPWIDAAFLAVIFLAIIYQVATAPFWTCGLGCAYPGY